MKKYLITLTIILATMWFSLTSLMTSVKADDYTEAVIGHVIQTEIQGNSVDSSVFEAELQRIAHMFSLEMISAFEKHLPSILDSISAELRAKTDKTYKCALQSDEYKNKDCNE